jgi:hypothetical protein
MGGFRRTSNFRAEFVRPIVRRKDKRGIELGVAPLPVHEGCYAIILADGLGPCASPIRVRCDASGLCGDVVQTGTHRGVVAQGHHRTGREVGRVRITRARGARPEWADVSVSDTQVPPGTAIRQTDVLSHGSACPPISSRGWRLGDKRVCVRS